MKPSQLIPGYLLQIIIIVTLEDWHVFSYRKEKKNQEVKLWPKI